MTRHTTWVVVALLACAACSDSSTDAPATQGQEAFDTLVDAACYDIGEAAYNAVRDLYADGSVTSDRQAEEYRIRANAVDALVNELSVITPTADLAEQWPSVLDDLGGYAVASRELADSVEEGGATGPVEHQGLERFRNLRLAGHCGDWLDMN